MNKREMRMLASLIEGVFTVFFSLIKLSFQLIGWLFGLLVTDKVSYKLTDQQKGWVYVLSNPSFPNMVKIGMTSRANYHARIDELNRPTSVPTKFEIEYTHPSPNPYQLEQLLHKYFADRRVNEDREFFHVSTEEIKIAIQKLES